MTRSSNITQLLHEYKEGDANAFKELAEVVYGELHRIAASYMRRERAGHSFQATELVGEAFLKLLKGEQVDWKDRKHFYRVAAIVMRRILIDHARAKKASPEGKAGVRISFDETVHGAKPEEADVLALDQALTQLAQSHPRMSQVVELRYFGGLDIEQTALALDCSIGTVKRDWVKAKTWLYKNLRQK